MNFWTVILLALAIGVSGISVFYLSNFASQARQHLKKVNFIVLIIGLLAFFHSCWQLSFFWDEVYYLLIPFPADYFSHAYLFLLPSLLALLFLPLMYKNWGKKSYTYVILSVILSGLGMFAYPGKDLIWFSVGLSTLLVLVGVKTEEYPLHGRQFLKYIFLENTWVALFYFKTAPLFVVALILQLGARFYLFNLLNLFWVEKILRSPASHDIKTENSGLLNKADLR